ncbi:MAG: DUF4397 domain-containing protein [Kofleriaceae bacterium]
MHISRIARVGSRLGLALALSLAALACGSVEEDPGPDAAPAGARFRVVHASPDAPAVDIHIEGSTTPLVSNLSYGEASPFLGVEPGTYNFQVRPTGRIDEPLYETGPLTVELGADVTAIATGLLASSEADDRFRILALKADFADPGTGARVRVVHASPDAPTVGVDVGDDAPGQPELDGLARFADSGGPGVALPGDEALVLGITAGGARVTSFSLPALGAGSELLVLAAGRVAAAPDAADGFALIAVDDDGIVATFRQDPIVYALHEVSDAGAVDVKVGLGGPVLIAGLAPGELRGARVRPGDYDLALSLGGNDVTLGTVTGLAAGGSYLAVAAGFLTPAATEEKPVTLIATAEPTVAAGADARVRFVHGAGDAPSVDFGPLTGAGAMVEEAQLLVSDLRFGEAAASPGSSLAAATQVIGVSAAGNPTPLATYDFPGAGGRRGFAITTGALTPAVDERAYALIYVDTTSVPWSASELAPRAP